MYKSQKDNALIMFLIVVIIVVGGSMFYKNFYSNKEEVKVKSAANNNLKNKNQYKPEENNKPNIIVVHIGGEVINPGVYQCRENSRLYKIINKAGGTTNKANLNAINLAGEVRDGQKIIIPSITKTSSSIKGKNKININTANQEKLEKITGVGPVTAKKIIAYRQNNGTFEDISSLTKVSGIGPKTVQKIKAEITY